MAKVASTEPCHIDRSRDDIQTGHVRRELPVRAGSHTHVQGFQKRRVEFKPNLHPDSEYRCICRKTDQESLYSIYAKLTMYMTD